MESHRKIQYRLLIVRSLSQMNFKLKLIINARDISVLINFSDTSISGTYVFLFQMSEWVALSIFLFFDLADGRRTR